ncbi:MAG: DUF3429 domain-containing protein [Hydrogenophaga sp.]|jgi:hypothetical protein|uniref:DUF3429 domain-containing protein n=1 Tax=Hydrogenophaga sp. TaxID=1904254 RepID=UPI002719621A|nr:DUF3429 domain-containing protein [Hydrogenophaga sp.]MDO9200744.1 DUF3429 domain-containing protein [Hydrogenophaga sp.]MDO9482719.1 DUF3429 domain-containing protein [Hydrogenophaga sp.]MDO9567987.1 DUF3429 domain-containing protein [Hydrogenophaga sp.]MDP2096030.1 DUF3429 domain-containing protein [Hydrogenophaga sp.]MDP2221297.1 DUF3429 domain-containing protein [Hydrogenophaga sp.]
MNAATAHPVLHDPDDTALARTLGHAGLIPFVLLAALLWLVNTELQAWVAIALAGYAALIASFMGGVHWGIAWLAARHAATHGEPPHHAQRKHLLWGVVPSLLAWPGLLMPPFAGLAWLGFVLVLCYLVDRTLYAQAGLQQWLTLRFRLSGVAALSCFVGAGAL